MITSIFLLLTTKVKEYTPHRIWIKFASLIFMEMDICPTSKNPGFKMKDAEEQNMIGKHDQGCSKRENTR